MSDLIKYILSFFLICLIFSSQGQTFQPQNVNDSIKDIFTNIIDPLALYSVNPENSSNIEGDISITSKKEIQSSNLSRVNFKESSIFFNKSNHIVYLVNVELPVFVKIFDVSGNIVLGKIMNTQKHINVNSIENGIYFIMLQNYGYTKSFKFTKE